MDSFISNSPDVLNNLISVKSAAAYSGYNLQYIRRLLRLGHIAGLKVGQLWLIDKNSFDLYINNAKRSKDQRFGPK